jgi:Ni,Fe-hydrogenase I cytochrome b subunit
MDMTPELLPPAKELSLDKKPELKLSHFPLAMLYLGGTLVILAVVVTVAVLFGAAVTLASIALFVAIAGLLLISFPFFFWAEYRKRRAELAHRQR